MLDIRKEMKSLDALRTQGENKKRVDKRALLFRGRRGDQ